MLMVAVPSEPLLVNPTYGADSDIIVVFLNCLFVKINCRFSFFFLFFPEAAFFSFLLKYFDVAVVIESIDTG